MADACAHEGLVNELPRRRYGTATRVPEKEIPFFLGAENRCIVNPNEDKGYVTLRIGAHVAV
jgi:hypothetical protein